MKLGILRNRKPRVKDDGRREKKKKIERKTKWEKKTNGGGNRMGSFSYGRRQI